MMRRAEPANALVVDDVPASLTWLVAAVQAAFPVARVRRATTLAEGLAAARAQTPELALVDLDLPDGSGVQLIEWLAHAAPAPLIVVATIFADDQHLFPALRAGASGYLLKDASVTALAQTLRGLIDGGAAMSSPIVRRLVDWFHEPDAAPATALSPREQELLQLLAKGLTIPEAARALSLSAQTAASYARSLYRKLQVTSRAEATLEAARRGLIRL